MILAHVGHWYISLLYVGPVVAVVGALKVMAVRERRLGEAEDGDEDATEPEF